MFFELCDQPIFISNEDQLFDEFVDFWVFHNPTVVMSGLTCSKRGPVKLKTLKLEIRVSNRPKG